jgi:hypothetical protein
MLIFSFKGKLGEMQEENLKFKDPMELISWEELLHLRVKREREEY